MNWQKSECSGTKTHFFARCFGFGLAVCSDSGLASGLAVDSDFGTGFASDSCSDFGTGFASDCSRAGQC